jgi:hypothetical protein
LFVNVHNVEPVTAPDPLFQYGIDVAHGFMRNQGIVGYKKIEPVLLIFVLGAHGQEMGS